jgi:hypothetical protein
MLNDELMQRLALLTECVQYHLNMSYIVIKLIEIGVGIPDCIA